jgi:nitrite reductase/ring-hydroxylating ferredoxin subunit
MPNYVRVASTADIPEGEGRAFDVNGKTVAVFNSGGTFYAIDNECKHQGGPLAEGELDGTVVTCPLHAWTYDVTSGSPPSRFGREKWRNFTRPMSRAMNAVSGARR